VVECDQYVGTDLCLRDAHGRQQRRYGERTATREGTYVRQTNEAQIDVHQVASFLLVLGDGLATEKRALVE